MKGRCWSQPEGTEFLPAACKALGKAGRGALPMAWGGALRPRGPGRATPQHPTGRALPAGGGAGRRALTHSLLVLVLFFLGTGMKM